MLRAPRILALVLALVTLAGVARAERAAADVAAPDGPVDPDAPSWQLRAVPFLWTAEQRGEIELRGIPTDAGLDFEDLVGALDVGLLLAGEAERGAWTLDWLAIYLDIGDERRVGAFDVDVDFQQLVLGASAGRRIAAIPIGSRSVRVDALAGATYTRISADFEVQGIAFGASQARGWVDPLVGLRLSSDLGDGWSWRTRLELGGFGVGSDRLWRSTSVLRVAFGDRVEAFAGYAMLSYDYDDGSGPSRFSYDVYQRGPVFGLRVSF